MNQSTSDFAQLYQLALRTHLTRKSGAHPEAADEIGAMARTAGLPVLEIAKLHERLLIQDLLPGDTAGKRTVIIRKAGRFFAAVIDAQAAPNAGALDAALLRKTIGALSDRSVELAAANRLLDLEIIRRRNVEAALRKSERHGQQELEKSETLKEQLRRLSRQILFVQEEERKKISRELHDVVAQALLGINVRLATLKAEARNNTKGLDRNISLTQKMVRKSTNIVHRFARELRPAALDDLGLIPALHSYMKSFTARTGIRTRLTAFEEVEKINALKRTTLYRVAQEALTNVARHAHASHVEVILSKESNFVRMEVIDDGRSFLVRPLLLAQGTRQLGLLGMRERVEMVGGHFEIVSIPGEGTTIIARIPTVRTTVKKTGKASTTNPPLDK
jgi:signal transduction histidine kinase